MAYLPVPNYPLYDNGVTNIRDVSVLDANFLYVSGKIPSLYDYGAKGDGITDDTAAIQAAITANYGKRLLVLAGSYLVTSLNITQRITLIGLSGRVSNFIQKNTNTTTLTIGDGTAATKNACSYTSISNIGFYANPGLGACTSGAQIFLNYTGNISIVNCTFDARDNGGAGKLFYGIDAYQTIEYLVQSCLFLSHLGDAHRTTSGTAVLECADGRIDFCEFQNTTGVCINFGTTTGGMVVTKPIMFGHLSWAIKIDSAAGSGNNVNFFIDTPDIECDSTGQGIYVKQGTNVQINGGWIGVNTGVGPVGLQSDTTGGGVACTGVFFDQTKIVLAGSGCTFTGCDIAGDNSTTTTGVAVASTATDLVITGGRIRQWTTVGIAYSGSPARCLVTGVHFDHNTLNITGDAFASSSFPPKCSGCYDDHVTSFTAAASLGVRHGMEWIFVTGATHITSIIGTGFGALLTILADTGGVNIDNTAAINLKGAANTTVTAGNQIMLQFSGTKWIEIARDY